MKFTNLTPIKELKELMNAESLIPKGRYIAEIVEATEGQSKKTGNEYIKLKLKIFSLDNKPTGKIVYDFLLNNGSSSWKFLNFCIALGDETLYDKEIHVVDLIGKKVSVLIDIEKDTSGEYADKNKVKDYLKKQTQLSLSNLTSVTTTPNDDIPF